MSGQLILVATPIGNLGDISERMKLVLEQADIIACEDSRHSGRLVKHMGITSPKYIVVNDHTERDACDGIIEAIMGGKTVALITDAGTPGIRTLIEVSRTSSVTHFLGNNISRPRKSAMS